MKNLYFLIAGALFGVWPQVIKKSNMSPMIQLIVFSIFSALVVMPFLLPNLKDGLKGLSFQSIWPVALAGILGGIGMMLFLKGTSVADSITLSRMMLIMVVAQVTANSLSGYFLFGTTFSTKEIIGMVFALAAFTCFIW